MTLVEIVLSIIFVICVLLLWYFVDEWFGYDTKERYQVVYPDGQRSMLMNERQAKDYVKLFGGKLIRKRIKK